MVEERKNRVGFTIRRLDHVLKRNLEARVQQEGIDFYLWFSKNPDPNDLEDWKIQLRQTVRDYDNTLDVLFNKIENKPFLKLKLNLISKETLNLIEHGQPKPLYSEEGEV